MRCPSRWRWFCELALNYTNVASGTQSCISVSPQIPCGSIVSFVVTLIVMWRCNRSCIFASHGTGLLFFCCVTGGHSHAFETLWVSAFVLWAFHSLFCAASNGMKFPREKHVCRACFLYPPPTHTTIWVVLIPNNNTLSITAPFFSYNLAIVTSKLERKIIINLTVASRNLVFIQYVYSEMHTTLLMHMDWLRSSRKSYWFHWLDTICKNRGHNV